MWLARKRSFLILSISLNYDIDFFFFKNESHFVQSNQQASMYMDSWLRSFKGLVLPVPRELLKANKWNILHLLSQSPNFLVIEDKTEDRETHKQAAAEGDCSEALPPHLQRGWLLWSLDFRQSFNPKDFPLSKTILFGKVIYILIELFKIHCGN